MLHQTSSRTLRILSLVANSAAFLHISTSVTPGASMKHLVKGELLASALLPDITCAAKDPIRRNASAVVPSSQQILRPASLAFKGSLVFQGSSRPPPNEICRNPSSRVWAVGCLLLPCQHNLGAGQMRQLFLPTAS